MTNTPLFNNEDEDKPLEKSLEEIESERLAKIFNDAYFTRWWFNWYDSTIELTSTRK